MIQPLVHKIATVHTALAFATVNHRAAQERQARLNFELSKEETKEVWTAWELHDQSKSVGGSLEGKERLFIFY